MSALIAHKDGMRQDTHLEADGAEHLVAGALLIRGISADLASRREPDYDVIATHGTLACRVQVKMRWATDYDRTFPLPEPKAGGCDFVVHVALNLGNRGYHGRPAGEDVGTPAFYVIPVAVARAATVRAWKTTPKVDLRRIPDVEDYRDRWDLIRRHLEQPDETGTATDAKEPALLPELDKAPG
jgi:hypothetical protein